MRVTAATRYIRLFVALPLAAAVVGGLSASTAPAGTAAASYRILFSSNRDGKTRVYSVLPDGSGLAPLLRSALEPLAVSRDGRTIAYSGGTRIYVSRADGSRLRPLAGKGEDAALSRNGKLLAFQEESGTQSKGIWIVGTDGRGLRRVTSGPDDWYPDLSPSGKALVFTRCGSDCDDKTLFVQSLHGKRHALARGDIAFPEWSPDGRWIAYARYNDEQDVDDLWVVRPDGAHRHRVARNADIRPVAGFVCCDLWSPDGRHVAFAGCGGVCIFGTGGKRSRAGRVAGLRVSAVTWSPDGRDLLLQGRTGDDTDQVWVVGTDGSGLRRVTDEGSNNVVGWTRLAPVLPPAAPVPPTERVTGSDTVATRAPVALLAADGPQVAVAPKPTATDCWHVAVWAPGADSLRRVSGLRAPCGFEPPTFSELALASARAAWDVKDSNSDGCEFTLHSATLAEPRPVQLTGDGRVSCKTSEYFHLRGDGNLLVFNDVSRLVRVGTGHEECGGASGVSFGVATVCATLRSGGDASPVDSASGGRIATRKPNSVTVLDDQGKLVRSFPFTPADVYAARLDGERLTVQRSYTLESYEVATGASVGSRPLAAGYRLADLDGGVAVLLQRDKLMLLRLEDGRSLTLTPGKAPVLADLEPPGLYYSFATGDGGGRVVFVPREELLRQLGGAE